MKITINFMIEISLSDEYLEGGMLRHLSLNSELMSLLWFVLVLAVTAARGEFSPTIESSHLHVALYDIIAGRVNNRSTATVWYIIIHNVPVSIS